MDLATFISYLNLIFTEKSLVINGFAYFEFLVGSKTMNCHEFKKITQYIIYHSYISLHADLLVKNPSVKICLVIFNENYVLKFQNSLEE